MAKCSTSGGVAQVAPLPAATTAYAVVIEAGPRSYGAYVPDLPGCVAVAETFEEVMALISEAIPFHLGGMRADGDPIPAPRTRVAMVEVDDSGAEE